MIQLELTGYDELLRTLDRIDDSLSGRVMRDAVKAAAAVVVARARQLCPPPGYEGDKRDPKPLRDTIGMEVRDYGVRTLGLAGPYYPAGAHGHLVEFGHRLVTHGKDRGYVAGRPFMRPAFEETKAEQLAAMQRVITRALQEITG